MSKSLDRNLASIFYACHDYYLNNTTSNDRKRGEAYKRIGTALTDMLKAMAAIHQVNYSGYDIDEAHAGYLIKFDPPIFLRVPYHVLPVFPTGRELEILWQLSRAIRSGNKSIISISGSNVMRKIFEIVGDIDFCEYFPSNDPDCYERMAINMQGNDFITCVRLSVSEKEWLYPWDSESPTKSDIENRIDVRDEKKAAVKFDYIGNVESVGVTEITNLAIAIDERGRSAGFVRTFAAQEAPLVPIDWLPNQMNDPMEMGRYIDWLARSIELLLSKGDMRKCMKRCASLARVLFLHHITDDIAELVNNSNVYLLQKIDKLAQLSDRLKATRDAKAAKLCELIENQSVLLTTTLKERERGSTEFDRHQFEAKANQIAVRLLEHLKFGNDPGSRRAA